MRSLYLSLCFTLLLFCTEVSAQSPFDVFEASIEEMQQALEQGQTTSVELVQQYLARIAAYDKQGPNLNSLIRINPRAAEIAQALDAERLAGNSRGMLHGIPIIVKDNYNTVDMPTTGGSVALAGFIPSANATQVDKLLAAGAIVLAKSNLHEFAYGITSISSLVGQTRNPYDIRRVPGGSSGGTAAAIAASFAAVGMGSDTCGSIRIPSAFNNLIGLRPSKGLSSIYGIIPLSHTQDTAGPLARNVTDLAIVLDAVSGFDANDPATEILQSQAQPRFYAQLDAENLTGLRFGRLDTYMDRADAQVRNVIEQALDWFELEGVEIVEVEIPELSELIGRSGVIGHEFRVDLNQYLALFLSEEILNLDDVVDQGLYHQAVQVVLTRSRASVFNEEAYSTALAARHELRAAVEAIMQEQQLDAIVYPPIAALPVFTGESQPGNNCSISANSGLPALSMPAGFSSSGLPVAIELLGHFFQDDRLLGIARKFEQGLSVRQPPAATPALVNGQPPQSIRRTMNLSENGLDLSVSFIYDQILNQFSYQLNWSAGPDIELYAATLVISDAEGDSEAVGLSAPVALNLIGPGQAQSTGSHFMGPQFRQAYQDKTLRLRVFASNLPNPGLSQALP